MEGPTRQKKNKELGAYYELTEENEWRSNKYKHISEATQQIE
jgi:hypothetical protein